LTTGTIREAPIVRNGDIVVGRVMSASLTFDHRTVSGVPAGLFLETLGALLEGGSGEVGVGTSLRVDRPSQVALADVAATITLGCLLFQGGPPLGHFIKLNHWLTRMSRVPQIRWGDLITYLLHDNIYYVIVLKSCYRLQLGHRSSTRRCRSTCRTHSG
jgi:hypothetical protein